MNDQAAFYDALAKSVIDPSPQNIRAAMDLANVEQIGLHELAKARQGLLSVMEDPSDDELAEAADSAEKAAEVVKRAREALAEAQDGLDVAESAHVRTQAAERVQRSRRLAADRARENPNVQRAYSLIESMSTQ